ncbi:uncharacterized protein LOC113472690 [Diaphorina citri]|uniref:Uncharacterized protein LOC113472690 n=1 Tax=Diaphorina citri TaxID=121845 RepID=A0A3Q0JIR9_DIACI|nr:uncharacterized protein LOC113472690 [Diaphorina citri]
MTGPGSLTGRQDSSPPGNVHENVIINGPVGGGVGRLTLSRYGGVVPAAHTSVRKSHHHQGGTTTLYTLGSASTSQRHHPAYLGASTPLIELTTGSRGSTTSPEVANIYDVIEEKSSRGGRGKILFSCGLCRSMPIP